MIRNAIKEASKSDCRCSHGSVVCRGGNVLGRGYNSYKTHRTWGSGPLKTLHAEAAAIRCAVNQGINVRGATIYVARENKNGGSQMSKPCSDCQLLITRYGISKVVYTDKEGNVITTWPLIRYPSY